MNNKKLFGSWYKQHETLDRLNIQAHKNALQSSDEYVMESFVTFDKVRQTIQQFINPCPLASNCCLRPLDDRGVERESLPALKERPRQGRQFDPIIYGGKMKVHSLSLMRRNSRIFAQMPSEVHLSSLSSV